MEVEKLKNQSSASDKFTLPSEFNLQDEEMKESENDSSIDIDLQDLIGKIRIGKDIDMEIKETEKRSKG